LADRGAEKPKAGMSIPYIAKTRLTVVEERGRYGAGVRHRD
jgi:hypothetical protein